MAAKTVPAAAAVPPAANSLPAGFVDQVVALYDFNAATPETIGFPKDAIINIIDKSGDWWLGEYQGRRGLLPYNYVQSVMKTTGKCSSFLVGFFVRLEFVYELVFCTSL